MAKVSTISKEFRSGSSAESNQPRNQLSSNYSELNLSPRDRARNILKREVYRLSLFIAENKLERLAEQIVRHTCANIGVVIRPRRPNAVDWSVRLVRHYGQMSGVHKERINPLFDDNTQSRMLTELKFGLLHSIDPELFTSVMLELGGFESIAPSLSVPDRHRDWIKRAKWNKKKDPIIFEASTFRLGKNIVLTMSAPKSAANALNKKQQNLADLIGKAYAEKVTAELLAGRPGKAMDIAMGIIKAANSSMGD
jgi:hypothetical protein